MILLIKTVDRRIAPLNLPLAFEPSVAIEPMTGQSRGWRPTLARCRRAAKTRQVVIGMDDGIARPRRGAP
jgi:hypothetical protein